MLEMLVDPVLLEWVPNWVVEQYERWNPFFRKCLSDALKDESMKDFAERKKSLEVALLKQGLSSEAVEQRVEALKQRTAIVKNAKLLAHVRRRMVKLHEQALLKKKSEEDAAKEDQRIVQKYHKSRKQVLRRQMDEQVQGTNSSSVLY